MNLKKEKKITKSFTTDPEIAKKLEKQNYNVSALITELLNRFLDGRIKL